MTRYFLLALCKTFASVVLYCAAHQAHAVELREMPLDERVAKSEWVGVADHVRAAPCPEGSRGWCREGDLAVFRVHTSLKGIDPGTGMTVACRSRVAEASADACAPGRYLLFLKRSPTGNYAVINGPFGALPLDDVATVESAAATLATDEGLIGFLEANDGVLTHFGRCIDQQVERRGDRSFTYRATCERYEGAASDCPTYSVIAIGTLDSETWATLRQISLSLECSS